MFPITHEAQLGLRSMEGDASNSNVRRHALVQAHFNDFHSEGDHIKVTASRYPFPTVCADKQSTDWFHAISRTLKWNERERQKSFVVVEEEGPPDAAKIKRSGVKVTSPRLVEEPEEEEELSDEEDTYDIDDSSPEADSVKVPVPLTVDESVGREKTPSLRHVTSSKHKSKSRSRSRLRAFPSGFDSPDRFASPLPRPPVVSPRHVEFNIPSSPSTDSSPPLSSPSDEARNGTRDDIRSPPLPSGKSRIPKDRDLDLEPVKTPIPTGHARARGHSRGPEQHEHRAFAVWGHDESDSNASDSET